MSRTPGGGDMQRGVEQPAGCGGEACVPDDRREAGRVGDGGDAGRVSDATRRASDATRRLVPSQIPALRDSSREKLSREIVAGMVREQYYSTRIPNSEDGAGELGCKHYRRSCKLFAPCCGVYVTCRLCHDEKFDVPGCVSHTLDRHAVKRVLCMRCWTPQDVGRECVNCGEEFARYFCKKCNLYAWDKDGIYHCDKCGLCRRGKEEDMKHCDRCQSCILKTAIDKHYCTSESMSGDCGVCMANLRTSTTPVVFLRCGHAIHEPCFRELAKHDYRCCVCLRGFADMTLQYQEIERGMLNEGPMPEEYAGRKCEVLCNDCLNRTIAPWHYQYFKCTAEIRDKHGGMRVCGSFNTRQLG